MTSSTVDSTGNESQRQAAPAPPLTADDIRPGECLIINERTGQYKVVHVDDGWVEWEDPVTP